MWHRILDQLLVEDQYARNRLGSFLRDTFDYDDNIIKDISTLFYHQHYIIGTRRISETILKIPQQFTGLRWICRRIYYTFINI